MTVYIGDHSAVAHIPYSYCWIITIGLVGNGLLQIGVPYYPQTNYLLAIRVRSTDGNWSAWKELA